MNNNYYDNPFEPRRPFDFYDHLAIKDAKKTVSRTMLGLFLISAISFFGLLLIYFALLLILGRDAYIQLTSNPYFYITMSTVAMYVVTLPPFFLITRTVPKRRIMHSEGIKGIELLAIIPVAQIAMSLGANVGLIFDSIFSSIFGTVTTDPIDTITEQTPIWLLVLITVVIGPIIEELIFRKVLIDRLSVYGNVFAIIVTAVAFGLFHGNFYQMFYAAALGMVLGYVAIKSGSWLYSAALHMLINLINGVLPTILESDINGFYTALEGVLVGDSEAFTSNIFAFMLGGSFVAIQSMLSIAGAIILVYCIVKHKISMKNKPECAIPKGATGRVLFANVGAILFLVFTAFNVLLNYIPF